MPVRLLTSPVLRWPDAEEVRKAVCDWAERVARERPDVVAIGYIGSYARGNWGVGSDLDIVVVVRESEQPPEHRRKGWDLSGLPVPVDLFIYTVDEWHDRAGAGKFGAVLRKEIKWVWGGEEIKAFEVS